MNGLRAVWLLVAVLLITAVVVALLPEDGGTPQPAPLAASDAGDAAPLAPPPITVGPPSRPPEPLEDVGAAFLESGPPAPEDAAATVAEASPAPRAPNALSIGLREPISNARVIPGNVVAMKDPATGEEYLLADGRYQIRGKGTRDDPYRVTWECLAGARNTYVPRRKEYGIPQRIALLHNKWVRVDGYIWFPLMVSESKELTIMYYQWDGCCIGIPPSPYDAIEVRLAAPARRAGGHATFEYGGVKGKFLVDPFLSDGFLSGLYLMEEAQLHRDVLPEL